MPTRDQDEGLILGRSVWIATVHHYAMAKGQTVIQLHGVGAWGITYVNPADDPRKKAAEK